MLLDDLLDVKLLIQMRRQGYVGVQTHPSEPLAILNYTQKCQYDRAWNDVSSQCRGLIYNHETREVVARPWPKFHNYGEHEEGIFELDALVTVTDKIDGSLGILYPTDDGNCAIATRGSFTSDQAIHATEIWRDRYELEWMPGPLPTEFTYLFEIIYPENRVVVDYGDMDDLVLLGVVAIESGLPSSPRFWPGPRATEFEYRTLAKALAVEPRPNCEGLDVHFIGTPHMVKLKQEDYVALHRILTGTNARNVWEVTAVHACAAYIAKPKHWGSFLGIDPARAKECLTLGDEWLHNVPDEFHDWVRETSQKAGLRAEELYREGLELADRLAGITDRASRYRLAQENPLVTEVMQIACAEGSAHIQAARNQLWLRCWREACPEPTAPFARAEAIA